MGEVSVEDIQKLISLVEYAKQRYTSYSGAGYPGGYQSLRIGEQIVLGQRNPAARLSKVPYDFTGKSVLDIGCNEGGMLLEIADKLSWAVGVDKDARLLNVATRARSLRRLTNIDFYTLDLENDPLSLLAEFLPEERVDICFFMSMCMWVSTWEDVLTTVATLSNTVLFETNGPIDFQDDQVAHLSVRFDNVIQLTETSDDDPQWPRKMYLAQQTRPIAVVGTKEVRGLANGRLPC